MRTAVQRSKQMGRAGGGGGWAAGDLGVELAAARQSLPPTRTYKHPRGFKAMN
jgi:hypothetical protein